MQAGGGVFAWKVVFEDQQLTGDGGFHLRELVGGKANGTPRKFARPACFLSQIPSISPHDVSTFGGGADCDTETQSTAKKKREECDISNILCR